MEPFDLDNPDPEPWQFCNELHQMNLTQIREILVDLRAQQPELYQAIVAAIRRQ